MFFEVSEKVGIIHTCMIVQLEYVFAIGTGKATTFETVLRSGKPDPYILIQHT